MSRRAVLKWRKELIQRLGRIPAVADPQPWQRVGQVVIGGSIGVGFAPDSDLLMVISSQGRGVFDATTATRVARDQNPDYEFDPVRCRARGIGPLDGREVPVAGLFGGGLTRTTADGYRLWVGDLEPLTSTVILEPPGSGMWDARRSGACLRLDLEVWDQILAAGFSPTGRSLVVAGSAELVCYTRPAQSPHGESHHAESHHAGSHPAE